MCVLHARENKAKSYKKQQLCRIYKSQFLVFKLMFEASYEARQNSGLRHLTEAQVTLT